jgi:HEAT repeat protein
MDPALRGEVAALTAQFVKSINQRSYYDPDHPAAQEIADAPLAQLQAWEGRIREVVFGQWGGKEQDEIAVEGVFDKAVPLAEILGQTNPYLEKLSDAFKRNRIVSLSLKTGIPREEFQRFVHVFVQHSQGPGGDDDGRALAQAIESENLVHISILVWSDLVGGRELAWPVRIVLSRLCKDIRILPLYARANQQDIVEAKRLLVGDMVRPLRRAGLIKELLMNCDVVHERVADWPLDDVEDAVVSSLNGKMLEPTCWAFLDQVAGPEVSPELRDTSARVLARLAPRLAQANEDRTFDLFRRLLELGLVGRGDLPEGLQSSLRTESWADDFEQDADAFMTDLRGPENTDRFEQMLEVSVAIFPELLRRSHPEGARRIVEALGVHAREAGQDERRKALLVDAVARLREPEHVALSVRMLEEAKPSQREHVRAILPMMGPTAVDGVLETLEHHEQQAVRKDCCTVLAAMGAGAAEKVLVAMGKTSKPWYFHRNLCLVLGSLGGERAAPVLMRATRHDHAKVRIEALDALVTLKVEAASAACVSALEDEEVIVQRRAVRLLVASGSPQPQLLDKLCDWLELKSSKGDEAPLALQLAAVAAIRELGNVPIEDYGHGEDLLGDLLVPAPRFALLGRLTGAHVPKDPAVQIAACEALAKMGTDEVLDALSDALDDESGPLRDAAAKAISAVRSRS